MSLILTASDLKSLPAQKILLAARCAGLALASKAGPPTTNSVGFPPLTSSWSLTDGDKVTLSTVRSALLYVAACAPSANLAGSTLVEQAQVDSWLSTLYHQLDWPLSVALAEKAGGAPSTEILTTILAQLEAHFLYQTYLVGHTVTVADLCLAASLTQAKTAGLWNADASPNLIRWYQTLINAPWWSAAAKAPVATAGGMHLHGVPTAVHSHLYRRRRIRVKEILADASYVGQTVTVAGWARTVRKASSKLLFIQINDGSVGSCLQCVLDAASCAGFEDCKKSGGTGASFMFTGTLAESKGSGQAVELKVTTGELLGAVFAGNAQGTEVGGAFYPMSKKEHTLEYLREQAHLRPRAAVHAAVMRIRHSMAYATHNFFHSHGFLYIHTPILTGADCEGAGEQFGVTSLLGSDHLKTGVSMPVHPVPEVKEMSKSEMKRLAKKKKKGTEDTKVEEEIIPGAVDYSKDFFGQRVNLTVSGQLNVETHACALSDVYTFGPTFRAEYSFTSRHLSEFWMIEPEIAFANLTDDINLAEDYLKYCVQFALENCAEDLEFFENSPHGEEGLRARLQNVIDSPFKRLTYTEAIEILQKAVEEDGVTFEEKPVWGMDLPSEHERYICEKVFKKPVVLMDYPKDIKAFYMKLNEDGKTVAAADVLVPKIGEIIGGSQREHRLDVLQQRCVEMNLDPRAVWWYLDLRKYGTVPHAGFGLGFERLILFVTGLSNIRDVIPFPRWAGNSKF